MLSRKISISFDGGPARTYCPGQIISGTVDYKTRAEDVLNNITITLRGVCKVKNKQGSKLGKEYVELFHHQEVLLGVPKKLLPGTLHSWPFVFEFPQKTGPDRSGLYIENGRYLFDEKPHVLPPSIGPDQADAHTRIEYRIYVVAIRDGAFPGHGVLKGEPITQDLTIRCMPDILPEVFPPSQPRALESKVSYYQNEKRSISQKISGAKAGLGLPKLVSFVIVALIPDVVVLGQPIPISFYLSCSPLTSPYSAGCLPSSEATCYHKSTKLAIIAHTSRRFTDVPHSSSLTESRIEVLGVETGNGEVLKLDNQNPTPRHFGTSKVRDWPPSFKSYSISRSYTLQFVIKVVCGGHREPFEAVLEVKDVQVIRPASHESRLGCVTSHELPSPLVPAEQPTDEEPPPYHP